MGSGKGASGSSGTPAPQEVTSTSTTSNLPAYAQPYYENLMNQAQTVANTPYQPYTGQRIADLTSQQTQATNLATSGVGDYQPSFDAASQNYASAANYNPATVNNTYNPTNFNTQSFNSPGTAQSYMNPYLNAALAPQIQLQNQQFSQQAQQLASGAASNGAFGGYRDGIQQSQNTLNNNLANQTLIGNGYNTAFNTAQGQFNTEQQQNLAANQLNNQYGQQASQLGMSATGANNQYGLAAAQLGLSAGQAQQGLGTAQQAANTGDINNLMGIGSLQQGQQQNVLNTAYQDFLNQRSYPAQQINWEAGILHGVPVSANSDVTGYQAPPSSTSQIAGLGLGAAGLSSLV